MRVISGSAKGTNLYSMQGNATRPTLDRIKETLFNIIQSYIIDADVLDLFSGSGALAIEALSRDARKAVVCDKSRNAIEIINKNLEKTHLKNRCEIINKDYEIALNLLKGNKFNIIFIDPPYAQDIAIKAVEKIIELQLLAKEGIIVIETDSEEREIKELENINISQYSIRKYGRVKLIFLNQEEICVVQ